MFWICNVFSRSILEAKTYPKGITLVKSTVLNVSKRLTNKNKKTTYFLHQLSKPMSSQ